MTHDEYFRNAKALLTEGTRGYDALCQTIRQEIEAPLKGRQVLEASFDLSIDNEVTMLGQLEERNPYRHWSEQMDAALKSGDKALAYVALTRPLVSISAMTDRGIDVYAGSPQLKALRTRINALSTAMGEAGVHQG